MEKQQNNKMMLRPHHLLCTQGYEGKGYSDGFVSNMSKIVGLLRSDPQIKINIVFSSDHICEDCPNRVGIDGCKSESKVDRYDKAVIELLGLQEKEYYYQELISKLDMLLDNDRLKSICGDCEWFGNSACQNNILSKKFVCKAASLTDLLEN